MQVQVVSQHAALMHQYFQQATLPWTHSVTAGMLRELYFSIRLLSHLRAALWTHCTEQSGALSCWGINPLPDMLSGSILPSSLLSALTFVTSGGLQLQTKEKPNFQAPGRQLEMVPASDCSPKCRLVFPTLLSLQHCVHVNLSYFNKLYVNS